MDLKRFDNAVIPTCKIFKLAQLNQWRASKWYNKILDWEWKIKWPTSN